MSNQTERRTAMDIKRRFGVRMLALAVLLLACGSEDIPQAHKGQMFDRTGVMALYAGGNGLSGPVLGPGTHYTGLYDTLRTVECGLDTRKESLGALTKDGVQFALDVYTRFTANCADDSVRKILSQVSTDPAGRVTTKQLYEMLVRPTLGESMRRIIAPYDAGRINENREKIFGDLRKDFSGAMTGQSMVAIVELNLSNLDFPDTLEKANVARAEQTVLKDKAIAERDRVDAEIETAAKQKALAEAQGKVVAAQIDEVGAALKRNPEYLQYQAQQMLPGIYANAGQKGNLVLAAPTPSLVLSPGVAK